jgi:hypothetical protein
MTMYTLAPLCTPAPGDSELGFVPSWIKLQLRCHIGKGIMALEAEILHELDRLIGGGNGRRRRQPVAIWACLWMLILAYRAHLAFLCSYFQECTSCESMSNQNHPGDLELTN